MGEVIVQVKLTNTIDKGMARRGLLAGDQIRMVTLKATVDTGAVNCVVPAFVADTLGLGRVFHQSVEYADGRRETVDVTEPVLLEIEGRLTYEQCLVLGAEVLIGQTALESTDLHVDCREGRVLPNPAHPYQPVLKVR